MKGKIKTEQQQTHEKSHSGISLNQAVWYKRAHYTLTPQAQQRIARRAAHTECCFGTNSTQVSFA